jgi:hypothetical protein
VNVTLSQLIACDDCGLILANALYHADHLEDCPRRVRLALKDEDHPLYPPMEM